MLKLQEKFDLKSENIDIISERFVSVCESIKMDKKETLRQRLALENALITWAAKYGENHTVEFISYKKIFNPAVIIKLNSYEEYNPFEKRDNDQYSSSILNMLTNMPEYYYSDGVNNILFKLKKPEMNAVLKLMIIIAASLFIAIVGRLLLPADIIYTLADIIINPLYDTFINILNCIAGPLIFFSVAWGIYGIGDVATFNRLGKSLMLFFLIAIAATALLCACLFPLFSLTIGAGSGDVSQLGSMLTLFLDFFPSNIIEPFATGNTIQIIILAIVMGIALLYLGKRSQYIATAINQLNNVVNFILDIIGKLVPFFIFLVILSIIWSDTGTVLVQTWKLILIDFIVQIICAVLFTMLVGVLTKLKPLVLAKWNAPASLIAISTSSSAASFGALVEVCENKYGINPSFVSFGVPLGIVSQRHTEAISYTLAALFVASVSGMEISVSWLLLAAFVGIVTAIATPPIPGGGAIAYAMMFSQLGFPMEYLGVMITFDLIFDFIATCSHVFCVPLSLTLIANRYGLIDKEKYYS